MAGKIFINYRRGDDPGFTRALYQQLEDEFTAADLFMDVEGCIKPGDDFVEVISEQVIACDVLLAVIGPRWNELSTARANDPDDFVAIEIKAALENNKRVIPVLVGGAGMPRADALPEAIRPLARRNAVGLRPERFRADCQGLITALKEQLAAAVEERAARTEAERVTTRLKSARVVEKLITDAEWVTARIERPEAAEERSRAPEAGPLSDELIRTLQERANWELVKDRNDVHDLCDHLARFPGGSTERYALAKLDQLVWLALGSTPDIAQLRAYLDHRCALSHTMRSTRTYALRGEYKKAAREFWDEFRDEFGLVSQNLCIAISTTLADLSTPPLRVDPGSAVPTSPTADA